MPPLATDLLVDVEAEVEAEVEQASVCTPTAMEPVTAADAITAAEIFQALSNPVRLRLLAVLRASPRGETCVCDLVAEVGLSQGTVSHHLAVLGEVGLVRRERRGTWVWYIPGRLERLRDLLRA